MSKLYTFAIDNCKKFVENFNLVTMITALKTLRNSFTQITLESAPEKAVEKILIYVSQIFFQTILIMIWSLLVEDRED